MVLNQTLLLRGEVISGRVYIGEIVEKMDIFKKNVTNLLAIQLVILYMANTNHQNLHTKPQELSIWLLDKKIPKHKLHLLKLQIKQVILMFQQGWINCRTKSIKFYSSYKTTKEMSLKDQNRRIAHGTLCDGLYFISPPPSSRNHPAIIL
ncbi:hypothetical protein Tco_0958771 [Tanacetum coccineum]